MDNVMDDFDFTLERCPFCGFNDVTIITTGEGKLVYNDRNTIWKQETVHYVWCCECNARGPQDTKEKRAAEKWNHYKVVNLI